MFILNLQHFRHQMCFYLVLFTGQLKAYVDTLFRALHPRFQLGPGVLANRTEEPRHFLGWPGPGGITHEGECIFHHWLDSVLWLVLSQAVIRKIAYLTRIM